MDSCLPVRARGAAGGVVAAGLSPLTCAEVCDVVSLPSAAVDDSDEVFIVCAQTLLPTGVQVPAVSPQALQTAKARSHLA